jgi:hypothetical protein
VTTVTLAVTAGAFEVRQGRRDERLRHFCQDVYSGLAMPEFLALEQARGIDETYLVPGDFQRQSVHRKLSFRSHLYDPDFECVIVNDGLVILSAELVP